MTATPLWRHGTNGTELGRDQVLKTLEAFVQLTNTKPPTSGEIARRVGSRHCGQPHLVWTTALHDFNSLST